LGQSFATQTVNRLEEDVWNEFAYDPQRLRAAAEAIRAHIGARNGGFRAGGWIADDWDDDLIDAPEGGY